MHNSAICMKSENLREFRKYYRAICAILQKFHCHIRPSLGPSFLTYMTFYSKAIQDLIFIFMLIYANIHDFT